MSDLQAEEVVPYVVADDFMSLPGRQSVWDRLRKSKLFQVNSSGLERVYRFHEFGAFYSSDYQIDMPAIGEEPDLSSLPDELQTFVQQLLTSRVVGAFLAGMGKLGSLSLRFHIYPTGAGLGWHDDGDCAGAFIYYAHPSWEPDWGGELLIANSRAEASVEDGSETDAEWKLFRGDRRFRSIESGSFVLPVPDRLVLIRSGVEHAITPVRASAGDHFRASVSGFFEQ